jgi:4'-phosphopantetheinyl transferase
MMNLNQDVREIKAIWENPPTDLQLAADEVHIWRSSLDLPLKILEKLALYLSPDEEKRANRFRFEHLKQNFIASRGLLRVILGCYLGRSPQSLQFSYTDKGKPGVVGINFNLSHSQNLGLYAITKLPTVGVDLEYIRAIEDVDKLAQRFFTSSEYNLINSLNQAEKHQTFFEIWTLKEAYLKATGEGLSGLQDVEVSLQPKAIINIPGKNKDYSCVKLQPGDNYTAAVVVDVKDWRLRLFDILV